MRKPLKAATVVQEIGNAVTHGIGAALAIAGLVILVVAAALRGSIWHIVAFSVFGSGMVLLYLASTLYHSFRKPSLKHLFEIFDHAGIFVLIAGTYTAFALTVLRTGTGWWVFGAVWAMAAFGIVMESLFLNRWPMISLLAYLAMGWLIVFIWNALLSSAPRLSIVFLAIGGLSYTFGTIFYALSLRRQWFHLAWHLFVIGGTVCHFFAALALLPA